MFVLDTAGHALLKAGVLRFQWPRSPSAAPSPDPSWYQCFQKERRPHGRRWASCHPHTTLHQLQPNTRDSWDGWGSRDTALLPAVFPTHFPSPVLGRFSSPAILSFGSHREMQMTNLLSFLTSRLSSRSLFQMLILENLPHFISK